MKYYSYADASDYGVAASSSIRALESASESVRWFPMTRDPRTGAYRFRAQEWSADRSPPESLPYADFDPACIGDGEGDSHVVMHTAPEYWPHLVEDRAQNIGCAMWETSGPPAHWNALLSIADKVLVPSEHAKSTMQEAGCRRPMFVIPRLPSVPLGQSPRSEGFIEDIVRGDDFMFYTVDLWQPHKAMDLLLHAYLMAFEAKDPVLMYVKTGPHAHDPASTRSRQVRELVQGIEMNYPRPARIIVDTEHRPACEIAALHRRGDCYVSLSRAEGWGMSAFDAAWLGTPVVMTGCGGQSDFLDPALCRLLDYQLVPVRPYPGFTYAADQCWAEPSLDAAIDAARQVFEHPQAARDAALLLSRTVRSSFDAATTTRKLIDAIHA